jgi:vancomycin resistance protein VanJ
MSRHMIVRVLAAYPITVAGLGVLGLVAPVDGGPLGLVGVLWAHLALAGLALVPVTVAVREPRALRLGLAALAIVLVVRLGGEWLSLPRAAATVERPPAGGSSSATEVRVITWNVWAGAEESVTIGALLDHEADLVALQELSFEIAAAIEASAELRARYPHRVLEPRPGVAGMGLLSRWPVEAVAFEAEPVRQAATIRLDGLELDIVNGHPFPARIALPFGFEPTKRNAELEQLRAEVDARIDAGRRVLLIGDFNTAPTEPAFGPLTAGLHDAHAELGLGPGWTWRPHRFEPFGIGLLRIDLVLGGPGVVPIEIAEDCSRPGDHCLVLATLHFG